MTVYVLSNPAMPGLIKIGRTADDDAVARIAQLYTTGVPVPFTVEYACTVENPDEVEKALHIAFGPNRINPKREFFKIDPEQAISILKLLHTEDTTVAFSAQNNEVDAESSHAAAELRSRRPNFNFTEMGIPDGAILHAVDDYNSTATVIGPKKVNYQGNVVSFSAATRSMLHLDYNVSPGPYWTYEGRLLRDIYEDTYHTED